MEATDEAIHKLDPLLTSKRILSYLRGHYGRSQLAEGAFIGSLCEEGRLECGHEDLVSLSWVVKVLVHAAVDLICLLVLLQEACGTVEIS